MTPLLAIALACVVVFAVAYLALGDGGIYDADDDWDSYRTGRKGE